MSARFPFPRSTAGVLRSNNASPFSLVRSEDEEDQSTSREKPSMARVVHRWSNASLRRCLGAITFKGFALGAFCIIVLLVINDTVGLFFLFSLSRARLYGQGLKMGILPYTQTIFYDCMDTDTLMSGARAPPDLSGLEPGERAIPLIATNLDYDTESFLTRLVDGWYDYPVRHRFIAMGGCDSDVLSQVEALSERHPDIKLFRQREPLGCAPGWNAILQYMQLNDDIEWALITNSDIYLPPGSLKQLSREIWHHMSTTPNLCRGYFKVIGGQDMVAFVYTRHALETLGFFDGNIYPAYLEDTEMGVRQARAMKAGLCSDYARFESATLVHAHNTTKYLSGTTIVRKKLSHGDRRTRLKAQELSMRVQRGHKSSDLYMRIKWRWRQGGQEYDHPFNDPRLPLSYWKLDEERRHCIMYAPPSVTLCDFSLAPMIVPKKAVGALTFKNEQLH